MKTLLTSLLFLNSILGYSQDTTLSKTNLIRIFTQSANGTLFNWDKSKWNNSTNESHKNLYSEWQTSNKDSAYYKLDTIQLYNYEYAYFNIKGGMTKEWHFYKKNRIYMVEGKYNSEPPVSKLEIANYRLKIKENESKLFLVIYNDRVEIDKFIVLNLQVVNFKDNPESPMYVLTLKRIKPAV